LESPFGIACEDQAFPGSRKRAMLVDLLPSIQAPTLIVHGSDDEVNPPMNSVFASADEFRRTSTAFTRGPDTTTFEELRDVASQLVRDFLSEALESRIHRGLA